MILCRIFGHRWTIFTAEQCPEVYRMCERCDLIEHVCNNLPELMPAEVEVGALGMMVRDHARMRLAGGRLAEAAVRVIHDYDGLHRLSLAVAGWAEAIAAEGDRPHAQGIEAAAAAETVKQGSVHESPVAKPCAQRSAMKHERIPN